MCWEMWDMTAISGPLFPRFGFICNNSIMTSQLRFMPKSKKSREVSALGKFSAAKSLLSHETCQDSAGMLHPNSKQSATLPGSFPLFLFSSFPKLPLFQQPPHSHFLSFSQADLLLTTRRSFQLAESFLASHSSCTLFLVERSDRVSRSKQFRAVLTSGSSRWP